MYLILSDQYYNIGATKTLRHQGYRIIYFSYKEINHENTKLQKYEKT